MWYSPANREPPRRTGRTTERPTEPTEPTLASPARIRSTIATIVDQPDDLRDLRLFHKALADVNRLRIVQRLGEGAATVTELIDHVGLSQPLVSWHVAKLKAAGIVETSRHGREVVCSLRAAAFDEIAERERALLHMSPGSSTPRERSA